MMKPRVLVTGAAGYVGSRLVPALIKQKYDVVAFDTFWYGATLPMNSENLTLVKGDLRYFDFSKILDGIDYIIHLACISNDPSFELNPQFSEEINVKGSKRLIDTCLRYPLKRFIFASSSSVYGAKKEKNVSEDLKLEPLTLYSQNKVDIEIYLQEQVKGAFDYVILRPATLMGSSPRLRLDVVTHILTAQGFFDKSIKVHGGDQFRPQLHIDDMIAAYLLCLEDTKPFSGEIFNVGDDNYTVGEIAETVKKLMPFPVELRLEKVVDARSYRISSEKFKSERAFLPKKNITNGVSEIINFFQGNPHINWRDEKFHNVQRLKSILSNPVSVGL